jgi:catechol 2,3-dioxygenase
MTTSIDPRVDIGHVHLKVADIQRALDFYVGVLGFEEQARYGDQAVFISAGGYHHHIGLNTWESRARHRPARVHGPLSRRDPLPGLARRSRTRSGVSSRRRIRWTARRTTASARRCTSEIRTGNGLELYRDRPKEEWPTNDDGTLGMFTRPLDVEAASRRSEVARLLPFPRQN